MKIKSTDELNSILKKNVPIEQYLTENRESFLKLSFKDAINAVFNKKNMGVTEWANKSNVDRSYIHHILSGKQKNPKRDTLIKLCIGMKADERETRALLLALKESPLYVKDPRDSIILYGIRHKLTLTEVEELLYDHKQHTLSRS